MVHQIMLERLQEPTLAELPTVTHGFFTRQGGVSEGYYSSLNTAYKSKDDPVKITENRRRIATYFGYSLASLASVKNVHGNRVVVVNEVWSEDQRPEADALVTAKPNIILGSDSADCPIVLLADAKAGIVGVAHAGWRGAKSGILGATVQQMLTLGAESSNMIAAISPCIAQMSYEVSDDFYQQFIADSADNYLYFKPANRMSHFMFDLLGYVSNDLARLGLKSIAPMGIDTYTDERFFSCRRAYHQGLTDFGCHFSCIFIHRSKSAK